MAQVDPDGGEEGWYYDDSSDEEVLSYCPENPRRIAFTVGAQPLPGAMAPLECKWRSDLDVCAGDD